MYRISDTGLARGDAGNTFDLKTISSLMAWSYDAGFDCTRAMFISHVSHSILDGLGNFVSFAETRDSLCIKEPATRAHAIDSALVVMDRVTLKTAVDRLEKIEGQGTSAEPSLLCVMPCMTSGLDSSFLSVLTLQHRTAYITFKDFQSQV